MEKFGSLISSRKQKKRTLNDVWIVKRVKECLEKEEREEEIERKRWVPQKGEVRFEALSLSRSSYQKMSPPLNSLGVDARTCDSIAGELISLVSLYFLLGKFSQSVLFFFLHALLHLEVFSSHDFLSCNKLGRDADEKKMNERRRTCVCRCHKKKTMRHAKGATSLAVWSSAVGDALPTTSGIPRSLREREKVREYERFLRGRQRVLHTASFFFVCR